MNKLTIRIKRPDDSRNYWTTEIRSNLVMSTREVPIQSDRNAKDPIHSAITSFFASNLRSQRRGHYRRYGLYLDIPSIDFNEVIDIGGCLIALGKKGNRYTLNGKTETLHTISSALARVTFKSCFEKDVNKLMKGLYASLSIPEDVKYCLENRVPFHFFDDFKRTNVRLNCQQISNNEIAIEVSDGIWGTMTNKELESFCAYYLHGKKRSKKWMFCPPETLYERTVGVKPKVSDSKLMIEFLKQNRQQDIVEDRAKQLVREMAAKYPDRLKVIYEEDEPVTMYVRGKGWDWKLTNNKYKSDIQMVSTFVYSTPDNEIHFAARMQKWHEECEEILRSLPPDVGAIDNSNEDEIKMPPKPTNEPKWKGPICIDNMSSGSSLGDQFVARALALFNDVMTVQIVSTINRYICNDKNTIRVDFNEMQ